MSNKKIAKNLNLQEGEKIILVIRRYPLVYWWQILIVLILLLLPFFLLYLLFQWAIWGPIIFVALLIIGLFWGLRLLVIWYFNCLVVTSQRLADFDQKGFFNRTVSETMLEKIEDIAYQRKGVWQSMFNYGLIKYIIPPGRTKIEIQRIKKPQQVYQTITDLINQSLEEKKEKGGQTVDSVESLKNILVELKEELGEEHFQKIVKEVEGEKQESKSEDKSEDIEEFLREE